MSARPWDAKLRSACRRVGVSCQNVGAALAIGIGALAVAGVAGSAAGPILFGAGVAAGAGLALRAGIHLIRPRSPRLIGVKAVCFAVEAACIGLALGVGAVGLTAVVATGLVVATAVALGSSALVVRPHDGLA